jgi:hypothetical protein
MLQYGLSANLDHRFGKIGREFAHARTAPSR